MPKPLLPVGKRPLLAYHCDALRNAGVTELLINTHYLSEQIEYFTAEYQQAHPDMDITVTYEETLLGSAGTLRANKDFFGTRSFFIVYGDNLTNINYNALESYHDKHGGIVTIACYQEMHPEQKGIVEFNPTTSQITRFIEKPRPGVTTSDRANAGIYVANTELFAYLDPHKTPLDFGFDVFPDLLNQEVRMIMYPMTETILDIGTPEAYTEAQILVQRIFPNESYND
jgi:NDP-sugar pyrophosphorylase family protein